MPKLAGVSWSGLDSFKDALGLLTADLVDEANSIMTESAQSAYAEIVAAYPARSGALIAGLELRAARGILLTGWTLVQKAPHGHLYEYGTRPRYNRQHAFRGVMPGTPTFTPIANAYRQSALEAITLRLYQHGASRVTGEPDEAA